MSEDMSWDEMEALAGIPKGPHGQRGYREEFEPGESVCFPGHPDKALDGMEWCILHISTTGMSFQWWDEGEEVPDADLVRWGMVHSPGHWRRVAQAQAIIANEEYEKGQAGE